MKDMVQRIVVRSSSVFACFVRLLHISEMSTVALSAGPRIVFPVSLRAQSTVDFPIGGHVNVLSDYKETGPEKKSKF